MRTTGVLEEEAFGPGYHGKHPQPVLDPLPANLYEGSIEDAAHPANGHRKAPSVQAINGHAAADVPPATDFLHSSNGSLNEGRAPKPLLLRARSDFVPRKQRQMSDESLDSDASTLVRRDGIRMRHGWENQLESPEQANLLSQVRIHLMPHSSSLLIRKSDFLHVLHRQAPRDSREPQRRKGRLPRSRMAHEGPPQDRICRPRRVFEHRRRSTRCHQNQPMCPHGVLD